MAWTGEWYPYAFSPFLQSFGGDIIDRDTFLTSEGVLNGPEAVEFGEWWQQLFTGGYAPGSGAISFSAGSSSGLGCTATHLSGRCRSWL